MASNTAITDWMRPQDAAAYIYEAIKSGKYQKGEIKKSSCKFANGKDKTDGYLCKVVIVVGSKLVDTVVSPKNTKSEIKRDKDGLIIPKKTAKADTSLEPDWIAKVDSFDIFELEDELHKVLKEGESTSKTVNIINLLNKRNYIKDRMSDLESAMDQNVVTRIHELDKIAGI